MPEAPDPAEATKERGKCFGAALKAGPLAATPDIKFVGQYGTANGFAVLPGGMFLGGPNFETTPPSNDGFVIRGAIRFLPDEELHIGGFIKEDVPQLSAWLTEMTTRANSGDVTYSKSNNNVKLFLALSEGAIFIRNQEFWKSLKAIDPGPPSKIEGVETGPPIRIDKLFYAVHPDNYGIRSAQVTEFLNTLNGALGEGKLQGVNPWPDAQVIVRHLIRMPKDVPVAEVKQAIRDQGGEFPDDLIERFHVGLNHLDRKHFVILTGISGTGKTLLVRTYARAIHGITDPALPDPFLFVCPVRPDWTDPSGLTGYYDVVAGKYIVPKFLEALLTARSRPDTPIFVCLDEMNLARVEYYLADVLSAMESGLDMPLHSHAAPVEGSTGSLIKTTVPLPPNVFIIGTINIDETTHPVSDKVLDRAVLIDTSEVDIARFIARLKADHADLAPAADACGTLLADVHAVLTLQRLGFGFRVAEEFLRYFKAAKAMGATGDKDVIDHQMVQKVLVKLRGTDRQGKMLEALVALLADYPKSKKLVADLVTDLGSLGSFQVTR